MMMLLNLLLLSEKTFPSLPPPLPLLLLLLLLLPPRSLFFLFFFFFFSFLFLTFFDTRSADADIRAHSLSSRLSYDDDPFASHTPFVFFSSFFPFFSFFTPDPFSSQRAAKKEEKPKEVQTPSYSSSSAGKTTKSSFYDDDNKPQGYAQKKFGDKVTSISSDQYFGLDEKRKKEASEAYSARVSQFSDARAISSADFFGRDEDKEKSWEDDSIDLGEIGTSIASTTRKLGNLASDWFNDFSNRYG
jgi:hypothetical protein